MVLILVVELPLVLSPLTSDCWFRTSENVEIYNAFYFSSVFFTNSPMICRTSRFWLCSCPDCYNRVCLKCFFLSSTDPSNIRILRHESAANMRTMPEFDQPEKGKLLLQDGVTFSWVNATDLEVMVQENGTKVAVKDLIYIVSWLVESDRC